jgi:hypothetical protein
MGSIFLFACGDEEPEPKPAALSYEQRRTLLDLFAMPAKIVGDNSGETATSAPPYQASSTVNCTPQQLMPPRDCPAGGNIYFTINLGCTGPSLCCGNEPPCQEDNFSISGLGTAIYNNCTAVSENGDRVVVNGSLHIGVDSDTKLTCEGVYDSETVVRVNGIPSVRVNGREACPGTVNLEARAKYEYEAVTTVKGSACGASINEIYAEGCIVACGSGSCCPGGSYCSSSGSGCVPNGYVDCGNGKHCPPGSQCTADGQNCQL